MSVQYKRCPACGTRCEIDRVDGSLIPQSDDTLQREREISDGLGRLNDQLQAQQDDTKRLDWVLEHIHWLATRSDYDLKIDRGFIDAAMSKTRGGETKP